MGRKKDSSSLIIVVLTALVFGLVMAVFGTSQACNLLKPITEDQTQTTISSGKINLTDIDFATRN